ncbi:DNA-directed RNA polymerase III subunit RPC4 [Hydra vulgaris]|uniref:DNA-directed RNA polymerase III subunit RPC4 n=1 Tax=Hydra vulgaris TaxID=6087 RepID=A0ABM4BF01_HYDVU
MSDSKNVDLKLSASLNRFGLKGRGGISTARLPSLKPARDLTLGGTPKRTFTPNIVGRSIKKEEVSETKTDFNQKRGGHFNQGRGRGRGRNEIIASSGIFSQGPATQQTLARALGGGSWSGNNSSNDNPSSIKYEIKSSKGFQEDDFESSKVLDILNETGEIEMKDTKSGFMVPITLPLSSKVLHEVKSEDESEEVKVAATKDIKKSIKKKFKQSSHKNELIQSEVKINDLFKSDSSNGDFFFFQFPDALPIKPISDDGAMLKPEQDMNIISAETIVTEQLKKFTFQNVSEGYIGKLLVHKSGKVKMHLGNVSFEIMLGTPCGFLQDLVSINVENDPGEMICLGHVNHRLIAVPDYEALLGSLVT